MKTILKKCRYVVTQNDNRDILENKDILIENGLIKEIATDINSAGKECDFSNKVVLPGMINTHAHLPMTLFRGYSDDLDLFNWLQKMLKMEAKLTAKQVYYGTMLGLLESIQFGTTTVADFYYFPYERKKAMAEVGINGFLDSTVHDKPGFFDSPKDAIEYSERFINDMLKEKVITPIATAHSIYLCSKNTLESVLKMSKKYDVITRIHVSETEKEVNNCLKENKATPIEFLEKIGWLHDKTMLVHANWVTNQELRIMKRRDVKVNHNPVSNMKLAYGRIMPLRKMIDMDITVSLATDGPTSNNNLDMFEDMKVSALMHKFSLNDPVGIKDQEIFDMANREGAKTLHILDKTGTIEIGKQADICAMELDETVFVPLNKHNNIISHLIYSVSGWSVSDTIVKGKFLYKNKQFTKINKMEIIDKVRRLTNIDES